MKDLEFQMELLKRGATEVISEDELREEACALH